MNKNIFVNLPVKDLEKSKEFFTKLGYTINKQFTDETASSIVISEHIYVMLLTHEKLSNLRKKILLMRTSSGYLNLISGETAIIIVLRLATWSASPCYNWKIELNNMNVEK